MVTIKKMVRVTSLVCVLLIALRYTVQSTYRESHIILLKANFGKNLTIKELQWQH